MPRRREVPKRDILPDPKFGNVEVSKFINAIMQSGKKSVAERIVYGAFGIIASKSGKDPLEVFTASDSLGWVYQFWQAKKKDEVNASEVKIGARELPAVTQLFTEPYMVSFQRGSKSGAKNGRPWI